MASFNLPGIGRLTTTGGTFNLPGVGWLTSPSAAPGTACLPLTDVTSWFNVEIAKKTVSPQRRFLIGTSDFSDRVKKWPTFKRDADKIKPVSLNLSLVNDDKVLNHLVNSEGSLNTAVSLSYGLTHTTSGDEFVSLFNGTIDSVRQVGGTLTVGLMDRFKGFSETRLGDTTSGGELLFTSSDHFPGDLMWTIVTSYGGLSDVQSDSNPDIDYDSWAAWKTAFEDDQIKVQAKFTGQKMVDVVKKMGNLFDSTVIFENNKMRFYRQDITAPCAYLSLGDEAIIKVAVSKDDKKIVNKQSVAGGYDVSLQEFLVNVTEVDSASQILFGVRDEAFQEDSVWLVDEVSCRNLAQRLIYKAKNPVREYEIDSTLVPVAMLTGGGLRFSDSQLDITSDTNFKMSAITIDMDTGKTKVKTKSQTILQPFILDVDTYSVLDQSYNFLL